MIPVEMLFVDPTPSGFPINATIVPLCESFVAIVREG